jgi:hypothetical protein
MSRRRRLSPGPKIGVTEHEALEWFEQQTGGARWVCTVLSSAGNVRLERLEPGDGWAIDGPGGGGRGTLRGSLRAAAGPLAEPGWVDAVVAAVQRSALAPLAHESMLLVERVTGVWFHATRSANRESIDRFGLDWRRMGDVPGIAGSLRPEREGVFVCRRLQGAYWFADMPRDDVTDIWAVRLDGVWLEADGGGGVDIDWALCPQPIPRADIELRQADIASGTRYRRSS